MRDRRRDAGPVRLGRDAGLATRGYYRSLALDRYPASVNESSPTVDVAFSWPTDRPSIMLTHGRFEGYPNPDSLRSLTATFLTRATGQMSIDASWPPAAVDATLTLADVSEPKPTTVDGVTYSSQVGISPAYSHALKAGERYQVTLMNDSPEGARPNLTATVTFP